LINRYETFREPSGGCFQYNRFFEFLSGMRRKWMPDGLTPSGIHGFHVKIGIARR
jgi:hypothetical protein